MKRGMIRWRREGAVGNVGLAVAAFVQVIQPAMTGPDDITTDEVTLEYPAVELKDLEDEGDSGIFVRVGQELDDLIAKLQEISVREKARSHV